MSTYVPSGKNLEQSRKWHIIDADGQTVGRLATEAARLLMGKNKPTYTPYIDVGDHVIVINAEKVVFTGNKWQDKVYRHHTGWPGGLKEVTARKQLQQHPERILESAIRGMLPKTKLGRKMGKKLKVYVGADHPHQAQQPEAFEVKR
jgi:large subunit ribosomal protein L13